MPFSLADRMKELLLEKIDEELLARIEAVPKDNLNEFGVDPFGYDPELVKLLSPIAVWMYRNYFRCEVHNIDRIPEGRFLIISNHSGQLPFDAVMIGTACLVDSDRPRILRSMVERWSAELPYVSHLFTRTGQVVGDPSTCRRLLEADEGVLVFPEGARGINKLFAQRYQLSPFGHGFMRLALETNTPIVPVAVIGAEEQAPAVADLKPLAKLLGFPALPIIFPHLVPLPLPVKYHLWFGQPMEFKGDGAEDDDVVAGHVKSVRKTVQRMIDHGLRNRTGVFS